MAIDDGGINKGIRVERIDGGEVAQKGVTELRESQNPIKPAGLTRPQGVIVPPVLQTQRRNPRYFSKTPLGCEVMENNFQLMGQEYS